RPNHRETQQAGSIEQTGTVTQYGVKSYAITARFWCARRVPNQRRKYPTVTAVEGRSSCYRLIDACQLYGRTPKPRVTSSAKRVAVRTVPKPLADNGPHSAFWRELLRLQSGT